MTSDWFVVRLPPHGSAVGSFSSLRVGPRLRFLYPLWYFWSPGSNNLKEILDPNRVSSARSMMQDKHPLMNDATRELFQIVNYVFLCSIVVIFGIIANTLNIAVFFKQGFNNTVNISFLALAISDLCCLLTLEWFTVCMNPLFAKSNVPMATKEVQYLTAGWPHSCFARITSWITVFVTAERCLCIAIPLKVKRIITSKRTTITLCFIYIINIITVLPEYSTAYIDWKLFPDRNATLLGLVFKGDRDNMSRLSFLLHAVLAIFAFVAVIVFTFVLVVNLKKKTQWRKSAISTNDQSESITSRDKRTVRMIILISTFLIIFYTPTTVLSMVTFFEAEFSIVGIYTNTFISLWSFAFLFEAINSSINIVLYYRMSCKFRNTFHEIFWSLETPTIKIERR